MHAFGSVSNDSFNLGAWLLDSSACHHFILDSNQARHDFSYVGLGRILVGDGNNFEISSVGFGTLVTSYHCMFFVNNVLRTPQGSINLLSVQKL